MTTHDERLFDFSTGTYCGVLIKENVMKKICKIQAKYLDEVKKVLFDEAEKENVFSAMWTLYHPNEKQTAVHFIDTSEDVKRRIKNATHPHAPTYRETVYIADSMDAAQAMAEERFEQTGLTD